MSNRDNYLAANVIAMMEKKAESIPEGDFAENVTTKAQALANHANRPLADKAKELFGSVYNAGDSVVDNLADKLTQANQSGEGFLAGLKEQFFGTPNSRVDSDAISANKDLLKKIIAGTAAAGAVGAAGLAGYGAYKALTPAEKATAKKKKDAPAPALIPKTASDNGKVSIADAYLAGYMDKEAGIVC